MYPGLKQRVILSEVLRSPTPPTCSRGNYHAYEKSGLEKAMAAVKEGISYRRASEMYGIPRSTLYDYYIGKSNLDSKSGPKPYLTSEEEEELVDFLEIHSRIGYPYTRKHVLAIIQDIIDTKGIKATVSNGWWQSFLRRHPTLTLRTAVPLSIARASATDAHMIDSYFDKLEKVLVKNDILDKANNIFNCDETGFSLSPKSPKVVTTVGTKVVSHITGDTKTQITVLVCTSASGYALPPFVIFDRKTLNPQLTVGEVPGTLYGLSKKGWIDRSLFSDWFFNHFIEYAPSSRPLLLILDGHSSHYCPDVIRAASEQEIIIFTLPPNTTHLSQPLDKGPFSPLKKAWQEVCHQFTLKNPGRCITRYDFSQLFSEAWSKSMTVKNIMSGFKTTGICPFDRGAVQLPLHDEEPNEATKLVYHPLYNSRPSLPFKSGYDNDESDDNSIDHDDPGDKYNNGIPDDKPDDYISDESDCVLVSKPKGHGFGHFLRKYPIPPHPSKTSTKPQGSGCVLTSQKSRKIMEEKELKKKEELKRKEERKKEREEKRFLTQLSKKKVSCQAKIVDQSKRGRKTKTTES
jgi:hypothetical protein